MATPIVRVGLRSVTCDGVQVVEASVELAGGQYRASEGMIGGTPATRLAYAMWSQLSTFSAAMKASCGMSTLPNCRIFFLPSFCFSSSLRLRVMSPP
jgi:hypothetical protein